MRCPWLILQRIVGLLVAVRCMTFVYTSPSGDVVGKCVTAVVVAWWVLQCLTPPRRTVGRVVAGYVGGDDMSSTSCSGSDTQV